MKSVKNFRYWLRKHQRSNFTSLKSRIALQVARKIAPCNMALSQFSLGGILRGAEFFFVFNFLIIVPPEKSQDKQKFRSARKIPANENRLKMYKIV